MKHSCLRSCTVCAEKPRHISGHFVQQSALVFSRSVLTNHLMLE